MQTPVNESTPTISRAEYIKYLVELLLARERQQNAHNSLEDLTSRRESLVKRTLQDPRLPKEIYRLDSQIAKASEELAHAIKPLQPRLDYLAGLSTTAPPHDVLFFDDLAPKTTLNDDETVSKAAKEVAELESMVELMKSSLLLDAPPPALPQPTTEDQGEPAKRRKVSTAVACIRCRNKKQRCGAERPSCRACFSLSLECEYLEGSTTTVPVTPKPAPPPDIPQLPETPLEILVEQVDDLEASLDHITMTQTDETQTELRGSLGDSIRSFRSLLDESMKDHVDVEGDIARKNKEWTEITKTDIESLQKIYETRIARNQVKERVITRLRAELEKQEKDLKDARAQIESLGAPKAQPTVDQVAASIHPAQLRELEEIANAERSRLSLSLSDRIAVIHTEVSKKLQDDLRDQLGPSMEMTERIMNILYPNEGPSTGPPPATSATPESPS